MAVIGDFQLQLHAGEDAERSPFGYVHRRSVRWRDFLFVIKMGLPKLKGVVEDLSKQRFLPSAHPYLVNKDTKVIQY